MGSGSFRPNRSRIRSRSACWTFGASASAASGPPGVMRVSRKVKLMRTNSKMTDWISRRIKKLRIVPKCGGGSPRPHTFSYLRSAGSLRLEPPVDDLKIVLAKNVATLERHDVLHLLVEGGEVLERDHVVVRQVIHNDLLDLVVNGLPFGVVLLLRTLREELVDTLVRVAVRVLRAARLDLCGDAVRVEPGGERAHRDVEVALALVAIDERVELHPGHDRVDPELFPLLLGIRGDLSAGRARRRPEHVDLDGLAGRVLEDRAVELVPRVGQELLRLGHVEVVLLG